MIYLTKELCEQALMGGLLLGAELTSSLYMV